MHRHLNIRPMPIPFVYQPNSNPPPIITTKKQRRVCINSPSSAIIDYYYDYYSITNVRWNSPAYLLVVITWTLFPSVYVTIGLYAGFGPAPSVQRHRSSAIDLCELTCQSFHIKYLHLPPLSTQWSYIWSYCKTPILFFDVYCECPTRMQILLYNVESERREILHNKQQLIAEWVFSWG